METTTSTSSSTSTSTTTTTTIDMPIIVEKVRNPEGLDVEKSIPSGGMIIEKVGMN